MSGSPIYEYIDAGRISPTTNSFNVTYAPVVDVNTTSFFDDFIRKDDGCKDYPTDKQAATLQHTIVAPVPHIEVNKPLEVFIKEPPEHLPELIDMPNWKSLSGTIIILLMAMTVISLFICLTRADYNFVIYLLGHHLWCIESKRHYMTVSVRPNCYPKTNELYIASKSTINAAKHFAILLAGAIIVDMSWLYLGVSAWLCEEGNDQSCWPGHDREKYSFRLKATHHLHQFAVFGSVFNIIGKCHLCLLSFASLTTTLLGGYHTPHCSMASTTNIQSLFTQTRTYLAEKHHGNLTHFGGTIDLD